MNFFICLTTGKNFYSCKTQKKDEKCKQNVFHIAERSEGYFQLTRRVYLIEF